MDGLTCKLSDSLELSPESDCDTIRQLTRCPDKIDDFIPVLCNLFVRETSVSKRLCMLDVFIFFKIKAAEPFIARVLKDKNSKFDLASHCIDALVTIHGAESCHTLTEAYWEVQNRCVKYSIVAELLEFSDPASIPVLIDVLYSMSYCTTLAVASIRKLCELRVKEAIPDILCLLETSYNEEIIIAAAAALTALKAGNTVDRLLNLLYKTKSPRTREAISNALSSFGVDDVSQYISMF